MIEHHPRRTWTGAEFVLASILVFVGGGASCKSRHAGVSDPTDAAGDRAGGDARGATDGATGPGADGAAGGGDVRADGTAPGSDAGGLGGGAGTDGGGSSGGDAATGGDAAPGDAGYGAGCNTLVPAGPVTVVCAGDAGAPPTPAGGPLVAGTYRLTAISAYGPCTAIAISQSLVLTATTIDVAVEDPFTGVSRANATYTMSGSNLLQTNSCPDTMTRTIGYTSVTAAGVTTLTLITVDSGTTTVATMTRP